jgi:hypothetical protein
MGYMPLCNASNGTTMALMQQGVPQTASVAEVRDEIQAISHSRLFAQSRRRIRLLEYLCDMVLLGRQDEIKETTIALEVFERTSEFDDKKDAIVRVEAHRLRERLSKYYATEAHDPLIIELSPGGYIPRFIAREPEPAEPATEPATKVSGRPTPAQPPFRASLECDGSGGVTGGLALWCRCPRALPPRLCFGRADQVDGLVRGEHGLAHRRHPHSRRQHQALYGPCGPPLARR